MPWTGASFKRKHNRKLSASMAAKAARIANAVLDKTGDEALAIKTANKQIRALKARGRRGTKA